MQPLYGIVLYNFEAQRPDELQAKAGEPIIVIAQSNLEWFVAKPIGRLGGPGLIPVSFVEIKDAITGRTITNVTDLMQKAAPPIPKVEEWKKMTQGYEESSISLGRLETGPPKRPTEPGTMPVTSPTGSQSESHHEEYYYDDRDYNRDYPDEESYREDPYAPGLDDEGGYGQPHNGDDILDSYGDRDLERTSDDGSTLPNARSGPNSPVISASVDSYNLVDDQYWFIVTVDLADGRQRVLYRLYEDFYEFQISLLNRFPDEAGRTGDPRILPFMPGPVNVITEMVTKQRQIDLDTYVKELCALPDYIVQSDLVEDQLFGIHDGDVESDRRHHHHQKNKSSTSSKNSRGSSPPPPSSKGSYKNQQRQSPDAALSKSSTQDYQDRYDRYDRYRDDQYDDRGSGGPMPSASTSSHAGPSIKVKIIHRDEIIAIKVSANSTFVDLCDKIYDRLGIDATLTYRDERKGTRMPLGSERDMERAMASASQSGKLMVYAD